MNKVAKLIVETFEQEQPALCDSIKLAVKMGESRSNFDRFLKNVCGPEYETSVTYSASLTVFDYYKNEFVKP
jgi:hypothetical protein